MKAYFTFQLIYEGLLFICCMIYPKICKLIFFLFLRVFRKTEEQHKNKLWPFVFLGFICVTLVLISCIEVVLKLSTL